MSVVGIAKFVSCSADWTLGNRGYTVIWHVRVNDPLDQAPTVLAAEGIPSYGSYLQAGNDSDRYSGLQSLKAERVEESAGETIVWRVIGEYSAMAAPPNTPADPEQPWLKLPDWDVKEVQYTIEVDEGRKGAIGVAVTPIMNAAGQRYVDAVQEAYSNTAILCRWWTPTVDLDLLDTYRNAINSAAFWGYAAGRLKVQAFNSAPVYEYGRWFAQNDITIEVNNDPRTGGLWAHRVLERGIVRLLDGQWVLPKDGEDNIHTVPMNLAADGTVLAEGATPVFTTWYTLEAKAFATIGLPTFPEHLIKTPD